MNVIIGFLFNLQSTYLLDVQYFNSTCFYLVLALCELCTPDIIILKSRQGKSGKAFQACLWECGITFWTKFPFVVG